MINKYEQIYSDFINKNELNQTHGDFYVISTQQFTEIDSFIKFIKLNKNKKFIYFSPNECIYSFTEEYVDNSNYRLEIERLMIDNNVEINCVFCGDNLEYYSNVTSEKSKLKFHYWPTIMINHVYKDFIDYISTKINVSDLHEYSINYLNDIYPNNFKKLYSHFNNKPRYHRCMMMDSLYDNSLMEFGYNSWNQTHEKYLSNGSETFVYKFKHWNEKLIRFDMNDKIISNSDWLFNDILWNQDSFMDLIGESYHNLPYLTEKTFRSLIIGKPFISYGSKNINKELLKYGIELYDEIIDYSFDSFDDLEDRINGVIYQLNSLKDKNFFDLYHTIKDKLKRNQNRVLHLLETEEFIPKILTKL